jgi:Domain of unknown function (DUF4126)
MELLPLAFTSGWTSGINAYATVLIVGLLGRFGALLAGGNGDLVTLTLASVGGVTALVSHLVKAGLRLAINTSPEPASNIGALLAGNASVAGVIVLAMLNPVPAAMVVAVLLVVGVWFTVAVMGRVRVGWRAFRRWLQPA